MKTIIIIKRNQKSVKSKNQCQSVIQTNYDIVKAHGGELKVNKKENEGTEFCIIIPSKPILVV